MKRLSLHRSLKLLLFLILLGIFEPLISNTNALVCKHDGELKFMKLHTKEELRNCKALLRSPIPYSYNYLDLNNREVSPFKSQDVKSFYWRHHLGTDRLGRDTLAGIIHGLRITSRLALITTFLACCIGLFFGFISVVQYYNQISIPRWMALLSSILLIYFLFIGFFSISTQPFNFVFLLLVFLVFMGFVLSETKTNGYLSLDDGVSKLIELVKILPMILILIVVSGFFEKVSYSGLIIIISVLMWPSFTRLFRGEFLKLSKEDFITSARAVGASTFSILTKHVVPNSITPLITHVCFSIIAIILMEATLSFLGIGVPVEEVSLGSLIKESRGNISTWWLAVFPGLVLYILLSNLNKFGNYMQRKR